MVGEHLDADPEYDRVYEEAGLAMTLGRAVYDRCKRLGRLGPTRTFRTR
jgi:hypothetical protein